MALGTRTPLLDDKHAPWMFNVKAFDASITLAIPAEMHELASAKFMLQNRGDFLQKGQVQVNKKELEGLPDVGRCGSRSSPAPLV
jgi:hypothetical protein